MRSLRTSSPLYGAGTDRVGVRDGRRPRENAPDRRRVAPGGVEHLKSAPVRISEEAQVVSGNAQDGVGGDRLIVTDLSHALDAPGGQDRPLLVHNERVLVEISVRKERDADRQAHGDGLLDHSPAAQDLVVRMRRQDEHPVLRAQCQAGFGQLTRQHHAFGTAKPQNQCDGNSRCDDHANETSVDSHVIPPCSTRIPRSMSCGTTPPPAGSAASRTGVGTPFSRRTCVRRHCRLA